ncbi:ABC transporter ATP-binding protein [Alteromonadaceae bacterium M269]|nr:ABC transporter ATP-binding protein [Alteromonadaceae bacterium M269]
MRLSVNQVSKQYASVLAVNELSFDVHQGEIFALLGPNGAGKSSTIRMLIGLTQSDKGSIQFTDRNGQSYERLSSETFGYLPEERGLYQESTILDTLVYMAQLKGMTKADAVSQANEWLERFDLAERKKDQLKSLSKGNQQKVQLISSIIHRPDIAFLDEPFSGLDPVNQEKVIEFLITLKEKGTTIILSAHQMSLVEKLADRFLLMNKGQAALYGSMDDIREETPLGATLTVRFNNEVSIEFFPLTDDVRQVEELESNSLKFTLSPQCNVPNLLQVILSEHSVDSIQTQQPTLHDIYLNSVQGAA